MFIARCGIYFTIESAKGIQTALICKAPSGAKPFLQICRAEIKFAGEMLFHRAALCKGFRAD
jgi:hypothetical protein